MDIWFLTLIAPLLTRLSGLRRRVGGERGSYTLEVVIIAALLAAAAIAAVGYVVSRIMAHAHAIQ